MLASQASVRRVVDRLVAWGNATLYYVVLPDRCGLVWLVPGVGRQQQHADRARQTDSDVDVRAQTEPHSESDSAPFDFE